MGESISVTILQHFGKVSDRFVYISDCYFILNDNHATILAFTRLAFFFVGFHFTGKIENCLTFALNPRDCFAKL
jgi:hypothetical protein